MKSTHPGEEHKNPSDPRTITDRMTQAVHDNNTGITLDRDDARVLLDYIGMLYGKWENDFTEYDTACSGVARREEFRRTHHG